MRILLGQVAVKLEQMLSKIIGYENTTNVALLFYHRVKNITYIRRNLNGKLTVNIKTSLGKGMFHQNHLFVKLMTAIS
jgi:hypothetical protein